MSKRKLVRVATVAESLDFLEGQLKYYSYKYEAIGIE